jgi:vesicle-associated membrane protein 4
MSSPYDPYANSGSKAKHVQNQLNEVVGIMQDNIDKVMERGERLDDISHKAGEWCVVCLRPVAMDNPTNTNVVEDLERGANQFRSGANKVRRRMWWKDMKLRLLIAVIVIIIILAIIIPLTTGGSSGGSSESSTSEESS